MESEALATEVIVSVYLKPSKNGYTIADVYEWLKEIEKLQIPLDTRLVDSSLALDYSIPIYGVDKIECGDHLQHDKQYDLIINMHDCSSTYKQTDKEIK